MANKSLQLQHEAIRKRIVKMQEIVSPRLSF